MSDTRRFFIERVALDDVLHTMDPLRPYMLVLKASRGVTLTVKPIFVSGYMEDGASFYVLARDLGGSQYRITVRANESFSSVSVTFPA